MSEWVVYAVAAPFGLFIVWGFIRQVRDDLREKSEMEVKHRQWRIAQLERELGIGDPVEPFALRPGESIGGHR